MKAHDVFTDDKWQQMLGLFREDLEESARMFGAVTRVRNVPCASNLLRMILAYSLSDLSLKDTAAWAKADGIANLTAQAFHYRLLRAEKWLQHLLEELLFQNRPLNPTELTLRVVDGSVITGPGSKGTDWVAHMIADPISGRFTSVELTDAKGAETFTRHAINPGEVVLGDRMYATARGIDFVVGRGAYPFVRVNLHSLKICALDKKRLHLRFLEALILAKGTISLDLLIPVPPKMEGRKSKAWRLKDATSWIPVRIVGGRTKKGVIWLLTTLSRDQLSDEAALKLYRLRWQVELLFKRLKSLLHLDALPTKDGPTSKSWLLGRLLAAAMAQALVNPTGLFSPRKRMQRRRVNLQSQ
jgi:Transposase DDE domain